MSKYRGGQGGMPVVLKWCAILASCLVTETCIEQAVAGENLPRPDARALYAAAGAAVGEGDVVRAIELLEQFHAFADDPDDEFPASHRWIIDFSLAELYAHSGRYEASLDALQQAAKRADHIRRLTTGAEWLDRWTRVAEHTVANLPAEPSAVAEVVAYLSLNERQAQALNAVARWQLHTQYITLALASRYERQSQLLSAVERYRQATEIVPTVTEVAEPSILLDQAGMGQRGYLRTVLKLAQASPLSPQTLTELQQLRERSWLAVDERFSVGLAICDCLLARREAGQALEELDLLQSSLPHSRENAADSICSMAYKRAEALSKLGKRAEAIQALESAIEANRGYPMLHEMHYLAGRLAILDADFERARQHLSTATTCESSPIEPRARSIWMMGETYFLQRSYRQAIACYASLKQLAPESPWNWRGVLQTAKCHELTDNREAALDAYRAFLEMAAHDSDFQRELTFASERLAALNAPQPIR